MFSLRMMLRVRTRALAARNPGGFACTSRCSPGRRPLSSRTTAALKAAVLFFRAFFVDYCADLRRQQRELRQAVPRSVYAVRRQHRALFEHHPSRRRRAACNRSKKSVTDIRKHETSLPLACRSQNVVVAAKLLSSARSRARCNAVNRPPTRAPAGRTHRRTP